MVDIESQQIGTSDRGSLVVMCGRSFSGKSTVATRLGSDLVADIVSLDSINEARGLFGGQGISVEEWIETHRIAAARTLELLSQSRTVVIDDTSSPRFLRDDWRSLAARVEASFALVFVDTPEDVILRRQHVNRADLTRHDVSDLVMQAHLESFEVPESDEPVVIVDPEHDSPVDIAARTVAMLSLPT